MTERKAVYNPEADQRWRQKNPDKVRYMNDRSASRRFIRDKATVEDLDELAELMAERRKILAEIV